MRADSNIKDTIELFKEKRRAQDNDLFYYINTIVEINSILFELRTFLEDAKQKHQTEKISKIEQELSLWRQDYQEYFDECQRVLQDLNISELSSYDEVEKVQDSQEWKDVNFLLFLLTRYHDLLKQMTPSIEEKEKLQGIVDAINARYVQIFKNKSLNEYNVNLFGEPKKLLADVYLDQKEEESLFEKIPDDEFSFDVFEQSDEPVKVEEPKEFLDENQKFIQDSLPHIKEEEQENWILYLKDGSHYEVARELISSMEKLENGCPIEQFYKDIQNSQNSEEILEGIKKYSKEYQRQVELIRQSKKEDLEEEYPVQNRSRSDVISELFFYIHLYDVQNSKKTNLAKVIESAHIELMDLESLNFSREIHPVENEEIMYMIQSLLEEYQSLIEQSIDIVSVCDLIEGKYVENSVSKGKKFSWVRNAGDMLSVNITKNKEGFYAIALARLAVSSISSEVPVIEEDVYPLVFDHFNVPVQNLEQEVSSKSIPFSIGDSITLKENAMVYRTEDVNLKGLQGEIPSYSSHYARKIEGMGILLSNGNVSLVFDEETAKKLIEEGNQIESVLVFDGFYSVLDAVLVESYEKGMNL